MEKHAKIPGSSTQAVYSKLVSVTQVEFSSSGVDHQPISSFPFKIHAAFETLYPKNRRVLSFPTCLGSIRGRGRAAQMGCENQMPLWKAVSELRQPTPWLVPLITAEMTVLELPLGLSHGYPADELSGPSYPLRYNFYSICPSSRGNDAFSFTYRTSYCTSPSIKISQWILYG